MNLLKYINQHSSKEEKRIPTLVIQIKCIKLVKDYRIIRCIYKHKIIIQEKLKNNKIKKYKNEKIKYLPIGGSSEIQKF